MVRAYRKNRAPRNHGDPDKRGRAIAATLFPAQPCEVCGKEPGGRGTVDRHHRNSDRLDNSPENVAFLCRKHHMAAHRLTDGKVGGGLRPNAYRVKGTFAKRPA